MSIAEPCSYVLKTQRLDGKKVEKFLRYTNQCNQFANLLSMLSSRIADQQTCQPISCKQSPHLSNKHTPKQNAAWDAGWKVNGNEWQNGWLEVCSQEHNQYSNWQFQWTTQLQSKDCCGGCWFPVFLTSSKNINFKW